MCDVKGKALSLVVELGAVHLDGVLAWIQLEKGN